MSKTGLGSALAAATRRVHGSIQEVVAAQGLAVDQWSVLDKIAGSAGAASMSEIAEATGLTGPSLTRAVDKLVTAALVFREIDARDRRKVLVDLSKRGHLVHADLAPRVYSTERELLTEPDSSLAELLRVLEGMSSAQSPTEAVAGSE
ncbi:MarR family winged helix-turn-helix transcriptional regulator [Nesterenkonia sphaerica]|nr:MarR family transcriptional regulator [Nesterenkonia sphaerica]